MCVPGLSYLVPFAVLYAVCLLDTRRRGDAGMSAGAKRETKVIAAAACASLAAVDGA